VLTHWLTIEKILERQIDPKVERCTFRPGYGKQHYSLPDAIMVTPLKKKSPSSRRAEIEAKIEELQAELEELED
jgi:multidrug efflux pump subunit AcrB